MKCLILDSNALISLFDGDEAVADIMSEAERILVPTLSDLAKRAVDPAIKAASLAVLAKVIS